MNRLLEVAPVEGLDAPQGVLSPGILVDAASLSVDSALVGSVVDFVNQAASQARLVPGEYPEEAIWCYCADYYFAQVNNGGHSQYAHNSVGVFLREAASSNKPMHATCEDARA